MTASKFTNYEQTSSNNSYLHALNQSLFGLDSTLKVVHNDAQLDKRLNHLPELSLGFLETGSFLIEIRNCSGGGRCGFAHGHSGGEFVDLVNKSKHCGKPATKTGSKIVWAIIYGGGVCGYGWFFLARVGALLGRYKKKKRKKTQTVRWFKRKIQDASTKPYPVHEMPNY